MIKINIDELPLKEENGHQTYLDRYKCYPPPLFIIFTSILQVMMFVYYTLVVTSSEELLSSPLIYRPDKRSELWRFATYGTLHAGWIHLSFNILVQVLVGLPLEMVHGSLRIGFLYLVGIIAGSLGTSVFDADVYLVGASGGVYALLAAHLANVLINYNIMQFACLRLLAVAFVATTDIGFAVYECFTGVMIGLPVSYIAHFTGVLSGVTLGIVILKNFSQNTHDQLLWWISLGTFTACLFFAIIFNILHPFPYLGIGQILHIYGQR
ncbi:unnamed protein product [Meganyctiphanes norvegica]|uniref:rhomboid protease n=1 Tax=Meganyctiphanes norvegica TaxID=48144 RepID=A0AAV2QQL4_MEGNR